MIVAAGCRSYCEGLLRRLGERLPQSEMERLEVKGRDEVRGAPVLAEVCLVWNGGDEEMETRIRGCAVEFMNHWPAGEG